MSKTTTSWKNWSGHLTASPNIAYPQTTEQVSSLIQHQPSLRPIGSGHSFTPVAQTETTLVDIKSLTGMEVIPNQPLTVKVQAGTTIRELGELAWKQGLSLANQGDIADQTLAGAFSTATHGTGLDFGCLASLVEKFTMVDANGKERSFSQGDEVFNAALVSLGTFGVLTSFELKMDKSFHLKRREWTMEAMDGLDNFLQLSKEHRNFEAFWFPWSDKMVCIANDPIEHSEIPEKYQQWNQEKKDQMDRSGQAGFTKILATARWLKFLTPRLNRLITNSISEHTYYGPAYGIFANIREAKFNEMEYSVPLDRGIACVKAIEKVMREEKLYSAFPIEIRTVKADSFWLSPFYQQAKLTISIHQDSKQNFEKLFRKCEEVFLQYDGVPHWGKWHYLKADALRPRVQRFDDFCKLRREFDPAGKFLSPYLSELFGTK